MFETQLLSKEKTKQCIDYLANKLKSTNISDKNLGWLMRTVHMGLPIHFLYMIVLSPIWVATLIVVAQTTMIVCFGIFGGCWLSMLEKKFLGDEVLTIDVFLDLFGLEINRKNRFKVSLIVGGLASILIYGVYFYRIMN